MKITVRVKPNSKVESVEKISDREFLVKVTASPHEGKANAAVIKALSNNLGIPKSRLSIAHGQKGKTKIIDIT